MSNWLCLVCEDVVCVCFMRYRSMMLMIWDICLHVTIVEDVSMSIFAPHFPWINVVKTTSTPEEESSWVEVGVVFPTLIQGECGATARRRRRVCCASWFHRAS